jgi:PPOX class probable FMN-dependent enzyme
LGTAQTTGTTETAEITEITTEAALREALGGHASGRSVSKERTFLHPLQIEWLQKSPFCVLATCDADGNCDASPKGDPAGHLIHVLNPRTIVIAERPGNKRADGYLNILSNPHVGVLALIPGRNDTLRVNGRARLVRDAPWFDDLVVKGKRPVLAILIEIDQLFSHCQKAFMRSGMWDPGQWPDVDDIPSVAELTKAVQSTPETLEELEAYYDPASYSRQLY